MGATLYETNSPGYALIVSLSLLFVKGASAQSAGTTAAFFKAHEEVVTELGRAAAIINSAAGVYVTIAPGFYVRRRMSGVLQYAVIPPIQRGNITYHRGSGTLVAGGLLNLPPADPIGDDIVRAEHGIKGGTAKQAMCSFYNPAPPLV